jgi:hypothetical protein
MTGVPAALCEPHPDETAAVSASATIASTALRNLNEFTTSSVEGATAMSLPPDCLSLPTAAGHAD